MSKVGKVGRLEYVLGSMEANVLNWGRGGRGVISYRVNWLSHSSRIDAEFDAVDVSLSSGLDSSMSGTHADPWNR